HELALLRGLTPLTKLATARWAVADAAEMMEALGGVGYCEDSGMPMLVRDVHVMPIWEGTTNVLSLDLLRAEHRNGAITAVLADAIEMAERTAGDPSVGEAAVRVKTTAEALKERVTRTLADPAVAQAHARSIAMTLAATYACAALCAQGAWAAGSGSSATAGAARRLAERGLDAPPPPDLDLAFA
ncbi:MAG TPA: acyl-CoA dehydrogenase family protein, partial [Actinomycetota bacterium]